jgi:hypothetical protein
MTWQLDLGQIDPGNSVTVSFWWNDQQHQYQGIQVAQARPGDIVGGGLEIRADATLTTSVVSVELDDPTVISPQFDGITYHVTVTNEGPWSTHATLFGNSVG